MMWNSALCMLHSARTTTVSRRKREEKEGKPEREKDIASARYIFFSPFRPFFFSRVPQSRALVTRHLRLSCLIQSGDDPLFVLPSFFLSLSLVLSFLGRFSPFPTASKGTIPVSLFPPIFSSCPSPRRRVRSAVYQRTSTSLFFARLSKTTTTTTTSENSVAQ